MLALAEAKFLKDNGCQLWDLGGIDKTPLYAYKWDLVGIPIVRSKHLHYFRQTRSNPILSSLSSSSSSSSYKSNTILIDDININHLLGHNT